MRSVAAFLREHLEAIVDDWMSYAEAMPALQMQSSEELEDHIPGILRRLADELELPGHRTDEVAESSVAHARLRHDQGIDIRELVAEYQLLRQAILRQYDQRHGELDLDVDTERAGLARLHGLIDLVISDAIDAMTTERQRTRELFVAVLGHDLRSPLQSVTLAAAGLVQRGAQLDPATLRAAQRIAAAAERMTRMVADLLDVASARMGGKIPLARAPLDLRVRLRDTLDELRAAYPDRDLRAGIDAASGVFEGEWDGDRLAQVVTNLVQNAVQHGADPVEIDLYDDGPSVRIEVRNRGVIAPDVRRRLFDPFSGGLAHVGNLGLGLYIVNEIVTGHGGEVDVWTDADTTAFAVRLPRHEP